MDRAVQLPYRDGDGSQMLGYFSHAIFRSFTYVDAQPSYAQQVSSEAAAVDTTSLSQILATASHTWRMHELETVDWL